jgi:hypothetical protein
VYELTQNIAEIRTMIKVGWDWTYYYKIWEEIEEFTHTEWFTMRLRDFARDSIEIRYWMDNYPHAIYVIFDPDKYITWFYGFKQYRFLKYIAIICWIWIFYYIMYCPGELFYNTWYVIIPWWVSIYFIFLWQYIKKFLNERQKGKDLYLYKYQAKKRTTAKERGLKPYHYTVEKWQEHKKQYSLEGSEGAWETNRSVNLKDNFNTFRREFIIPVMFLFFIIRDFYAETWRFRTFSGYDYYKKYDPEAFMNRLGSNSYTRRHFKMDSWDRIEYGGNVYNVFYINYYRKNKGWKNRILDKGLYKTDPELYNVPFNFDNHIVKIIMNESDFGYFYYSLQYKKMFSEIQWKLKANNKEETDDVDDATVDTAETNIDDTAGMYKGIHGYQLLRKLYKDFHGNWKMDGRFLWILWYETCL